MGRLRVADRLRVVSLVAVVFVTAFDGLALSTLVPQIAVDLHRQVKSIDNALQRVKRKLEKYMESRGDDLDIGTVYRGLTTINRGVRTSEE